MKNTCPYFCEAHLFGFGHVKHVCKSDRFTPEGTLLQCLTLAGIMSSCSDFPWKVVCMVTKVNSQYLITHFTNVAHYLTGSMALHHHEGQNVLETSATISLCYGLKI